MIRRVLTAVGGLVAMWLMALAAVPGTFVVFSVLASTVTTVIDQSSTNHGGFNSVSSSHLFAQTFTSENSGRLAAVELLLGGAARGSSPDMVLSVHPVDSAGAPDMSISLGSVSVSRSALPQTTAEPFRFHLDGSSILVTAGEQLAFVIRTSSGYCCDFAMGAPFEDLYPVGAIWRYSPPTWVDNGAFFNPRRYEDMWFRTYVEISEHPDENTTAGSNVEVAPAVTLPDGTTSSIFLTFDNVETAGDTIVTASETGQPPPTGFKLTSPPTFYEITTTATFSGRVRVCLSWTEGQVQNEGEVAMFHDAGQGWVDITDPTSRDTVNNTVCGTTTSLSPFTLFDVKYPFSGFFSPVENLPTTNAVKAGSAVPVKFSLGGDLGLDILVGGFPRLIQCDTLAPIDEVTETVTAGSSSLSYDPQTGRYTYVWKTDKAWGGSCRELQIKLTDGEVYRARFTFRK